MQNEIRFYERIYFEYIPLFIMLLLCPFFYNEDTFLTGITARFIGTIFLISCMIILLLRNDILKFNRLDLIFILFILFYGFRILLAHPVFNSNYLIHLLIVISAYVYFRNIRYGNIFFLILYLAGLIQSIWYVLQILNLVPSYHYLFEGTGCFSNPSILAIFLVVALLSGIASFQMKYKFLFKVLWWIGLIFLFGCIATINSRASWIALLVGAGWIGWTEKTWNLKMHIHTLFKKHLFIKYLCFGLMIGVVLCGIYGLYLMRQDSVHGRFLIWKVIGSNLFESLGFGHGGLQARYMPLQAQWFMSSPTSIFNKFAGNNIYAFNEFLRITFEAGIVGFFLFYSLIITAGIYSFRGNRISHYSGAIFISMICFGLFSYPFSIDITIVIAVVILAVIAGNFSDCFSVRCQGIFNKYLIGSMFLVLGIFTSREYILEKKADLLLSKVQQDFSVSDRIEAVTLYEYLRGNPDFVLCYGKTLFNHKLYEEALPVLEQAFHLKPSSELVCDLGICYQYTKNYDKAEEAYLLASYMTPVFIIPQYRLFNLYVECENVEKATEKAEYLLSMPVKIVNTSVLRIRNQAGIFLKNGQITE